jgi:hypothetical protein
MVNRTAVEAKADNIVEMGEPLGELYSALWQAVGEFVEALTKISYPDAEVHMGILAASGVERIQT